MSSTDEFLSPQRPRPLVDTSMTPPGKPVPYLVVASAGERYRRVSMLSEKNRRRSSSSPRAVPSTTTRAYVGPAKMLPAPLWRRSQRGRSRSTASQRFRPPPNSSSSARMIRVAFPRGALSAVWPPSPEAMPPDEAQADTARTKTSDAQRRKDMGGPLSGVTSNMVPLKRWSNRALSRISGLREELGPPVAVSRPNLRPIPQAPPARLRPAVRPAGR